MLKYRLHYAHVVLNIQDLQCHAYNSVTYRNAIFISTLSFYEIYYLLNLNRPKKTIVKHIRFAHAVHSNLRFVPRLHLYTVVTAKSSVFKNVYFVPHLIITTVAHLKRDSLINIHCVLQLHMTSNHGLSYNC